MNSQYGGACLVNTDLFPNVIAYVAQGSQQTWRIRDIAFHPFHLHEAPVRLASLPTCATSVTNNWKVGDWADTVLLPVCQTGCSWPDGDACSATPTVCDEVVIQWLATNFSNPVPRSTKGLCRNPGYSSAPTTSGCKERWAVFHCHILPHESEGCTAFVNWYCPDNPPAGLSVGECPTQYPACR